MTKLHRRHTLAAAITVAAALTVVGQATEVLAGEGIFVPPPKDAGDTLDNTAKQDTDAVEVVRTVKDDVLTGRVVRIGTDGMLHLTGPQFNGRVMVLRSSLESVDLHNTIDETAMDEVFLTNGDHLLGELNTIGTEAVVIHSEVVGTVKIPRKMVISVAFALGKGILVSSNFANGRMEPWRARGGTWSVEDGRLICTSRGTSDAVHARLDQKEAATFVARVRATASGMRCAMVLFADSTQGHYGRNSVYASVYNNEYHIGYSRDGRNNTCAKRSPGRTIKEGTLRFAYDPETGKARLWLDSTDLGEVDIPTRRASGKYVLFISDYPSRSSSLRVLRGIVPPYEAAGTGEQQFDLVEFNTNDQVSATDIILADGKLVIKTAFGELKPSIENVSQIVFRKKDREEAPRLKGDVYVETSGSRMTVQLDELTAEHLLGSSGCYGAVNIRRGAVRNIQFSIEE